MKASLNKRYIDSIETAEGQSVTITDTDDKFLNLVVSGKGRKTWRYIRWVRGKTRFVTIGQYPGTTPDMAKRESRRLSAEYDGGGDPAQEKKSSMAVKTWGDLFDWYLENHAKPHKRTWEYDVKMNDLYLSAWKRKACTDIKSDVVTRLHVKMGKDNGKAQADRTLAMIKTVFSKSIDAGTFIGVNPAGAVKKFFASADEYGRERHLSGEELKRLLITLGEYHDQDMTDFFLVCLFTGARRGNVQSMRWDEMNRDNPALPTWIIPKEKFKGKRDTEVAIVEPVVSILNRRWENRASDEWVFPAKRSGGKCPHLSEPKKAWATICKKADLQDVRIHDLRRTLGSWQAALGSSLQVIGKSLGHRSMKSTEIYARLDHEPIRKSVEGAAVAMLAAVNQKGGDK